MKDDNRKNKGRTQGGRAEAGSRVTETIETESEIVQNTEDRFHTIFDLVNDAIFIHDADTGAILDVNQRMCEMYGVTREEAVRLEAADASSGEPPYTAEEAHNWLRKALSDGPQLFEWHARHKTGRLFWVEVNIKRATIDGKDCLLVTTRDITERKNAQFALKESESRYRELFETLPDGFASVGMDGGIGVTNPAFRSMVGYTEDELCCMTYQDLTPAKWHAYEKSIVREQVFKKGYSDVYEKEYVRKDGAVFPIEIRAYMLRERNGESVRMWGFVRDITTRKQAEGLLQEYEEAVEGSQDMIATVDRDYRYCLANAAFLRYRGMSREQVIGRSVAQIVGTDLFEQVIKGNLDKCFRGEAVQYKMLNAYPGLGERDLLVSYFPIVGTHGIDRVTTVIRDVTEQRLAEAALKQSEEKYRQIFENAVEGMFQTTPEGRYISVNPALATMCGFDSPEEMIGTITDIEKQQYVYPEGRAFLKSLCDAQGFAKGFETQFYRKDGGKVWVSINARAVKGADGKTAYFEGSFEDITPRKRAEETLKESEETLRALINATRETLLLIDGSGRVLVANEIASQRLGMTVQDLIGTPLCDHFPPDVAVQRSEVFGRVAATGESVHFTDTREGRVYETYSYPVFSVGGKVSRIAVFAHDVTQRVQAEKEKMRLESQLRQSQKMEAIGTLAGGIAHDFNNILTAIIGYGSLLRMGMENDPRRQYADHILASSEKAATLTQSLLAFSRKQAIELKPRKINEIIRQSEKLLRRLLTEDIEFFVTYANSDMTIEADVTQMDQVLMNLAANARDAMPRGGRFTIETKSFHLDDDFIQVQGFGEPGDYCLITVTDTGMGMNQETLTKVFEPFFTTKDIGKGTGLGLSIVYGIIKQHNGYITVSSEPDSGTRFDVYLPIVKKQAVQKKQPQGHVKGGNETILVAEDNNEVRTLAKEVLTGKGYTVVEAKDGSDAVRLFMEHKDEIALLLLDVVMPGKNGKEAYEEIRRLRPNVKVLFTSGYTGDIVFAKGVHNEEINYIAKPLVPNELQRKVREVLDK